MAENSASAKPVANSLGVSKNLLMGGVAGGVAKTIVAPLERLRLLKQTGAVTTSMRDTFKTIVSNEGVLGLWRGNVINVIRVVPARGVLFASNDFYRALFKGRLPVSADPEHTPFWMMFSSGGLAGMTAIIATYPLDVARTRLAGRVVHQGEKTWSAKTTSVSVCLKDMAREEGIKSWYRGIGPTMMGALPYEGIKFSVYGTLTTQVFPKDSIVGKLVAGGLAGVCAGAVLFPNDTVRKMMQIRTPQSGTRPYSSAWDCWKRTYQEHGVQRFYRGIVPYLIRMAPSSAIQFAVYETLRALV